MSDSMNRLRFEQDLDFGFSNKQATGKMPEPLPNPLLLNLGCGKDIRDGFVNIDIYSDDLRVVYGDCRKLSFPNESVDFILASDILEHFSHHEVPYILQEWARLLKPNAEIIIRCPSLSLQVKAYSNGTWDADIASYMIFGGQTNQGDYHCIGFDEASIRQHLQNVGLIVTGFSEEDIPQDKGFINLNMVVRARKVAVSIYNEPSLDETPAITTSASSITGESRVDDIPQIVQSTEESTNDDDLFDIDLLSEIIGMQANISHNPFADNAIEQVHSKVFGLENSEFEENFEIDNIIEDIFRPIPNHSPQLNIVWEGSQFVWHSLALINREHCSNLIDSGVANVTIIPYEPDAFSPDNNEKYQKIKANDIRFKPDVAEEISRLPYIWIRHQWPPKNELPKGAKWIVMQPWEFTTHRKDFIPIFEQADEIWTPSNFSRQSFVNSGISFDKVQVIPNGINPNLFKPSGDKFNLNTLKRMKFIYVGGTIYRKGFDVLLDVYLKTFTKDDEIVLIVKDLGSDTFYRGQTAKANIVESQNNPNAPEIIYIDQSMSEEELASLYRACDVLVCPYRGEGFSLPTLEAMACGLPVIVTKGGSTDDFTDEYSAWYISANSVPIGNEIDGKELTDDSFLLEPNKDELAAIMKYVSTNPTQILSAGLIASAKARKDWTWRKATIKMLERIDYLNKLHLANIAEVKLPIYYDDFIGLGIAERYFENKQFDLAEQQFDKLSQNDFETKYLLHIYNRLTQIALNNQNHNKASDFISKARHLDPTNIDMLYLEAIFFYSNNLITEAYENLTNIFERWTDGKFRCSIGVHLDSVLSFCGDIALAEDDLDGAHQYYTAALKANPNNADACYGASICFEKIGNFQSAKTMKEWAEKLDSKYKI